MTNIYLIRHGETILNEKKLVQGWSDSPLTTKGIEVAIETGKKLKDIYFNSVFTSDLSRTYETAKLLLNENCFSENLTIIQSEQLREMHFGKYESNPDSDMTKNVIKKLGIQSIAMIFDKKGMIKNFVTAISESDETGVSETYDFFSKRIFTKFNEICVENENAENILIVTHGLVISVLLNELGYHLRKPLKNASITKITYDKLNYNVISVNS